MTVKDSHAQTSENGLNGETVTLRTSCIRCPVPLYLKEIPWSCYPRSPHQTLQPIHTSNIFRQKKRRRGHPLCLPRPLSPGCTAGNCDLTFSTVPLAFPSLFRADMPPICSALFLDGLVKSRSRKTFYEIIFLAEAPKRIDPDRLSSV